MEENRAAQLESAPFSESDAQLIERFQQGENFAFDQLQRRYYESVYQIALRKVTTVEDAHDLAQETFLRAYRGLRSFKKGCQFYTWLYRIAVNLCIDFRRRKQTRRAISYIADDDLLSHTPDLQQKLPWQVLENEELSGRISQAISTLPPKQRQIFILHYLDELPLKEIARQLMRSIGTVKSHLFLARQRLQNELQPYLMKGL